MSLKSLAPQMLVLAGLSAVAGTVSNTIASSSRHLKWWSAAPVVAATPAPVPTPPMAAAEPSPEEAAHVSQPFEIDTARALAEHAQGTVFLDARRTHVFDEEGRIAGARGFAVWESDVDDKIVGLMAEQPFEATIVVYCNGGDCTDSHLLRDKLMAAGFSDVLVYQDGFPGWVAGGHAVER